MSVSLTFRKFFNPDEAKSLSDFLNQHNIDNEIENDTFPVDSSIMGTGSQPEILLKLQQKDFSKAELLLSSFYAQEVQNVGQDYYLFQFTNEELKDVIYKNDEWGTLDHELAKYILRQRGTGITDDNIQQAKEKRLKELAEPIKASTTMLFAGYFFLIIFPVISLVIGLSLWYSKRTLPNGDNIYSFTGNDRQKGRQMIIISIVIMLILLIAAIVRSIILTS